ncbi:uncharacterized protein LOC119331493 [Triticum dicoccoides]|uniref:DUF569 domain-containing protein n=1 Tax=Triticum turgidum subsp. durum TaxID=4567 RepID=A0A9R0Z3S6_TRITD|nr:uncharacterized protein LOC119331493 [Triticum dicoccoides]VAI70848.1 unnamed protein product [Triticum turgidum subsp. durum]
MDRFYDEQYVRLRNRKLDKYYLHADDDGVGVSISQRRNSLNVAWKVHIYQGACGPYLLLHSAAYGRYLAVTATPAPALYHGFRAELRDYDHPEVPDIMWLDVRAGLGPGVLLLNAGDGDRYLRANGKYLRWNTGVTVESRDIENEKVSSMMRWIVEPIDLTERAPRIPDPIRARLPEDLSVVVFGRQPGALREIRFVQATPEGVYPEAQQGWAAFNIRGRSLYNLRDRLAREVDLQPDGIAMCIRAGRYGRLTPLVVDLPRRGWGDIYQIVVFSSGTAAYAALRYPNVDGV